MKKFYTAILIMIVIASLVAVPTVHAEEKLIQLHCVTNQVNVQQGQKLSFVVSADVNFSDSISTFRIKIAFHSEQLKYLGITAAGKTTDDEYKTNCSGNEVTIIYLTSENGFSVTKNEAVDLFQINFEVLGTAEPGDSTVTATADGFANNDVKELSATKTFSSFTTITQVSSPDCSLRFLQPDSGELYPAFRSDVTEYEIKVPYETDKITMIAQAKDSSALVKVNRKTLEKAGTPTLIKITVQSQDRKYQCVYQVTVLREEKDTALKQGGVSSVGKTVAARQDTKNSASSQQKQSDFNTKTGAVTGNQLTNVSSSLSEDSGSEPHYLIMKENKFSAFLVGFLLCAVVAVISFFTGSHLIKFKKMKK